ncbi:hypothetical protein [Polyangium aurulentum]|uniref:hypothetical protein n=1 Tax=Polyangium aurulentum TaxID=2567896 RepID=UPI00200E2BD7|nr:hypothetical protein [Polyangium aurulentum]
MPWTGVLGAALLGLLLAGAIRFALTPRDAEPAASSPSAPTSSPERRRDDAPPPAPRGPVGDDAGAAPEAQASAAPPSGDEARYPVDLEHLRALLPDNLYFRLGAPTDDPATLQARAEEERRWNDLYGKIQSNTATEEEIRSYYDHRRELSEDYVEFASVVLEEYEDKLPERDRGLYELSIKMHKKRLEELPRNLEDALSRRVAQEKRREEWIQSGKKN